MSKFALLKFLVCTVKTLNFDINEIFKKNQCHIRVQFEKLFKMSYILGKLENMSFSTFFLEFQAWSDLDLGCSFRTALTRGEKWTAAPVLKEPLRIKSAYGAVGRACASKTRGRGFNSVRRFCFCYANFHSIFANEHGMDFISETSFISGNISGTLSSFLLKRFK